MARRRSPAPDSDDALPLAEQLAAQFYQWECRGRGWLRWDHHVRLEPPFTAFPGYRRTGKATVDDGREQTFLSGVVQWIARKFAGESILAASNADPADQCEDTDDIVEPDGFPLVELEVSLPVDTKSPDEAAQRLILAISAGRAPLAFEVIGLTDRVVLQFVCAAAETAHVRSQVEALYPDATVRAGSGLLAGEWERFGDAETIAVEFGLSREFVLPLNSDGPGGLLVAIAGTMEQVEEGELAMLQVIFEPVRNPWAESVLRAVATPEGDGLFGGVVDLLDGARAKIAEPLYAAIVRVACRAATSERACELARRLGRCLDGLADPMGNELFGLDPGEGGNTLLAVDVPLRRSRRSGMILSGGELAALVHLPGPDVRTGKFRRSLGRTKAAPPCVLGRPWQLGLNEHAGQSRNVTLDREQRVRHTHVIGASGTGKSTLLRNLIVQDIVAGQGVALLDPHGDLVDEVLARLPPHREQDVVLFDPADEEFPIGFNVLAAHTEAEKTMLASDLVGVFRRLSTSWGDQMTSVLGNGVLAFLESDRGGTLADLRRFLVEPKYRAEFLTTVRDPQVAYYWKKEFPLLVGRPQGPVLTRLDSFLRPKAIRHVVAQRANRLDFADIMDGGKIFLARLSHGAMGEENAHLLGALLVSKFHQIALARQRVEEGSRRHFWLYVDEFQHFATPSMASLLSGVRKYRLGLILAHQELHQLESRSPEVASAVMTNAHTRICFRVGDHDARKLEGGFATFTADDVLSLGIGEAVCRVERSDFDFNLRTSMLPPVEGLTAAATRDRVVAATRQKYASTRHEVEEQLRRAIDPSEAGSEDAVELASSATPSAVLPVISAPTNDYVPPAPPALHEAAPSRKTKVPSDDPVPMGRGGPEHKYLQQSIKQWGDGMGYRSTIEKGVLGGAGSIDVALEKQGVAIACQVSVTTSVEWEVDNTRKALKAGFAPVILVSAVSKHLAKLRKAMEVQLSQEERGNVHCLSPEEMFEHLQGLEISKLKQEQMVRGYKVKRSYKAVDSAEGQDRRQAVSRVVAEALKKLRSSKKPKV
jgi:hypothetical protein